MSRKHAVRFFILAAAVVALIVPTFFASAQALDFSRNPNYGSASLTAGFLPDPHMRNITSGGSINVSYLGGPCTGFATAAPDYRIQYTGSGGLLRFLFNSTGDTTLIINAPNGQWFCNDDSGGTLNPTVNFANAASGQYDVWVGSYQAGTNLSGVLRVTELSSCTVTACAGIGGQSQQQPQQPAPTVAAPQQPQQPSSNRLNHSLNPNYGSRALTSGFTPDPNTVAITSGGGINVNYLGGACRGFATAAPDFTLNYTEGNFNLLRFFVRSNSDTTLVINGPDGRWFCNDDSFSTLNPTIDFTNPASGQYDVWVGSYAQGGGASSTLYITELSSQRP